MTSPTPDTPAALGARIRELRRRRRMSLRELGDTVSASAAFLGQIERGATGASVATLRRVAGALGLTVAELFEPRGRDAAKVLRRADRPTVAGEDGVVRHLVSPLPLRRLEVHAAELQPGAATSRESEGASQEILLVLRGEVVVEVAGRRHRLAEGDSIDYDSTVPHRVLNDAGRSAEVLWIASPPYDAPEEVEAEPAEAAPREPREPAPVPARPPAPVRPDVLDDSPDEHPFDTPAQTFPEPPDDPPAGPQERE